MGNAFIEALEKGQNTTFTENGAVTNRSSLDAVLDYFALAGAMRSRPQDAAKLFIKAYAQDPVLATKTLFYLRDVRGGQGERSVFITGMRELYKLDEAVANNALELIAEYGRWYDLVLLAMDVDKTAGRATANPAYDKALALIKAQLDRDQAALKSEKPSLSLLGKWLPSVSTTSKKSQLRAHKLAEDLGMKPRVYRKLTTTLRKQIGLLEHDMTERRWEDIDYSKLPGQAFRKHTKAFKRHTPEKFEAFTKKVVKGEAKVNADAIYPYEVYEKLQEGEESGANAMWASLPDYTRDENALVIADVSGSMIGRPMAISVSLAMYFAERNKGIFNGYFMTFSASPKLQKVAGATLSQKMYSIQRADWGMNTNIQAAFKAILKAAVDAKAKADEVPRMLYIISDMEFDSCTTRTNTTNFDNAKKMFAEAGYELPHVVFWNVDARQDQTPATKYDNNVTLISGASAATFKYALAGKTPLEGMLEVLSNERYAPVEKAFKAA